MTLVCEGKQISDHKVVLTIQNKTCKICKKSFSLEPTLNKGCLCLFNKFRNELPINTFDSVKEVNPTWAREKIRNITSTLVDTCHQSPNVLELPNFPHSSEDGSIAETSQLLERGGLVSWMILMILLMMILKRK